MFLVGAKEDGSSFSVGGTRKAPFHGLDPPEGSERSRPIHREERRNQNPNQPMLLPRSFSEGIRKKMNIYK